MLRKIIFSISILIGLSTLMMAQNMNYSYKNNSVLKTGNWYKFKIAKTGIYSFSFNQIKNMGFSDPANVCVYGQMGGSLPLLNDGDSPDDLTEIPLYFDIANNRVYFYLKGPDETLYNIEQKLISHKKNNYSFHYSYFISDIKKGKNITQQTNNTSDVTHTINDFDDYLFHELDTINVIQSGRAWFGEKITASSKSLSFDFEFDNMVKESPVHISSRFIGRSSQTGSFVLYCNDKNIGTYSHASVKLGSSTDTFARIVNASESTTSNSEKVNVKLLYQAPNMSAIAYLDFIGVQAKRKLIKTNGQFAFRNFESVGEGNVGKFVLSSVSSNTVIWDVTDIFNVKKINGSINGTTYEFKTETSELKEFVAFNLSEYYTPVVEGVGTGKVENQNLHGLPASDYVIVAHEKFMTQAEELADFHRNNSNLNVLVVNQEQVLNEFSSGTRDVSAVRNFMKMTYDRTGGEKPRYLLLFGDGSYDNKRMDSENNNLILTYQSQESIIPTSSFVSDDFYGLLDSCENIVYGRLDIGVGRFPVSDTNQANVMVDKVKLYMDKKTYGDWRNNLCFIGDDQDQNDGTTFMVQSDELSGKVSENQPWYNNNKLYLDAYKQVSTSVGARYPDVNKEIFNQLKKGALIVNYIGHGAEFGLAHERIISNDDIRDWSNWGKFPLFMTATCEFSRYDYMKISNKGEYQSVETTGEYVVTYDKGGAIASFTTTRVVYSGENQRLNRNFFNNVFGYNEKYNERYRLGDIIKNTKVATGATINKRNFSLLGDPAIILAYPEHNVIIDSINGYSISNQKDSLETEMIDTLGALSYVTITGHVEKDNGILFDDFNGEMIATVFDKTKKITTLDNDRNDRVYEFYLQNNVLFKGKASVDNGYFKVSFRLPKDISYLKGRGRISCYAYNESVDATGWDSTLIIGGFDNTVFLNDNDGPKIDMFLGNYYFKNRGLTDESPSLIANVYDENGINTSTSGIGHEMIAVIDGDYSNPIVMNDFYQSDVNDYTKGTINFPLLNLEPGEHKVSIKVWDVLNNSSEEELFFEVVPSDQIILESVYNFPNPVVSSTNFAIEHNMPGEDLDVEIRIFSMSGQLVKILKNSGQFEGYLTPVVFWDGRADNGGYVENGMYFYRVMVSTEKGTVEKSSKMIIIR